MGPVHIQKRELKRDVKYYRHVVSKARKMVEALLDQLEKAEKRLDQTEGVVDAIPGTAIDNMFKLLNKNADRRVVMTELMELMQNITLKVAPKTSKSQMTLKIPRKVMSKRRVAPPHMTSSAWLRRSASIGRLSPKGSLASDTHTDGGDFLTEARRSRIPSTPPAPPNSRKTNSTKDGKSLDGKSLDEDDDTSETAITK